MAAPTYVSGTTAQGLGAVTPAMPTGATTNDLLVLVIESEGTAGAANPPAGGDWTQIGSAVSRISVEGAATRCTVYWAAYDAALNRTVPDSGNHTLATLTAYRDVELSDPINTSATSADSTAASSHSVGGVTTDRADTMVVVASTHGRSVAFSNFSNPSLSGLLPVIALGHPLGSEGAQLVLIGTLTSAGSSGTTTWDTTLAVERASVTFALNPLGFGYLDTYSDVYGEPGQQLVADIQGTATVTAALTNLRFYADLQGTATVTAALTLTQDLTALTATIEGTGTVTAATVAVASIQVTALELTGTYTPTGIHNLVADIQGSATVVSDRTPTTELTGSVAGTATVTAALTLARTLSAVIDGTGTVTVATPAVASIQITALEVSGSYTSTGTHNLVADFEGSGTVGVTLGNVTAPLTVPLTGTATVASSLYTLQALATSIEGTATVTAAFAALRDLTATLEGTATFAATPLIEYVNQLSATIVGTATLTGTLEVPTVTFVPLLMGI